MRKLIYNLEFPSWCPHMTIFGYRFERAESYEAKVTQLQHIVNIHAEFMFLPTNGGHEATAYVDLPSSEKKAVLEWHQKNSTALDDIALLLSLFTSRDVFTTEDEGPDAKERVFVADPRVYRWGGILRASIPYKEQPIEPDPYSYDIGFEEGLDQVYRRIRTKEWQLRFQKGYFLFLARQAFHQQSLESSFIQCWTIWEHLFTIHTSRWLSDEEIRKLGSIHKVAFLLVEYALTGEIDKKSRKKIQDLAEIRNRLVHFGQFPDKSSVYDDASLFIQLTQFIIAKILGLSPSNIFNTIEKLESFLQSLNP